MDLRKIEQLVRKYKRLAKGVPDYGRYAYYAATHHSTSIEGSTLTQSQVINLIELGKPAPNKPFEHHQMVYDHYQAIVFVTEAARQKKKLTPEFISQIAAKVMHSTGGYVNTPVGTYDIARGEYRKGSVRAGTRTFPDYAKVARLVLDLCRDANARLMEAGTLREKCDLAFRVHFRLVSIHPFGDGNGRTSRLLMNYVQAYFDLPLSIVFKQDRIRYINALEAARKADDLAPYLEFMYRQYAKFMRQEIRELEKP